MLQALKAGRLHVHPGRRLISPDVEPSAPPPAPDRPAPDEGSSWFSLQILDEVGDPVDGLEVVYSIEGRRRSVTTDGSGIARVDGVAPSFASAAVKSLTAAREKLKSRWQKPRAAKPIDDPTVHVRELDDGLTESIALTAAEPATLVLTPFFRCHEVPGANFAFGRSFVRADALDTLALIAEALSADDDGRQGMIFGHTDLAGSEALNKELSERRAKAVHALFTHDADAWEELFSGTADGPNWKEKWDLEEAQHMLNALRVTDDAGNPINERGIRDESTKQAIHRFQAGTYPDKPAEQAPLAASDLLGKDGRKELFLAYAKRISRKPIKPEKLASVNGAPFMGCGEYNPLSLSAKDRESRRVVVFVFDVAATPGGLPCQLRNIAPCKANLTPPDEADTDPSAKPLPYRCKVYREVASKCPCKGGADLSHDVLVHVPVTLNDAQSMPHVFVLDSDDGTIRVEKPLASDARALDDTRCELQFVHLPTSHSYRLVYEADGQTNVLFDFTPYEDIPDLVVTNDIGDVSRVSAMVSGMLAGDASIGDLESGRAS